MLWVVALVAVGIRPAQPCAQEWGPLTNEDGHARPSDVKVLIGTRKTLLPAHNEYMINT